MIHYFQKSILLLCALVAGSGTMWGESKTVKYTISSKNTLTTTGTAPTGSSATIAETYSTSLQMTSGNSQTLTLNNYNGYTITKIHLRMKSNASSGAGKLRYSTDGGSSYTYLVGSASSGVYFNSTSWYGSWSTSYVDIYKDVNIECGTSSVIIKIEATANSLYCSSYELTYNDPTLLDAELSLSGSPSMSVTTTQKLTTTSKSDGIITFESSDPTIASVSSDGVVTANKVGSVTITATQAETDIYLGSTKTVGITVTTGATKDPSGCEIGYEYIKVTDASTLKDGDNIVIVSVGTYSSGSFSKIMGVDNGNNRTPIQITISSDRISTLPNNTQVITLEKSGSIWYLNTGSGYLYAGGTGDNNYLKTGSKSNSAKATISISGGDARIIFANHSTNRNDLTYNPQNVVFSCYNYESDYSNTKKPIQLYRRSPAATTYDINIGTAEWKAFVSAHNVSFPNEVNAYIVSNRTETSVTYTKVDAVAAGVPVILNAPAKDYTLTIVDDRDCDDTSANLLQVSDENTGNGVYVLSKKSSYGVGFYKWMGGGLGKGYAYLPAYSGGEAREFLTFDFDDDQTTGIETVNGEQRISTNGTYDLQGRPVSHPTKGMYIMNGKLVIIK